MELLLCMLCLTWLWVGLLVVWFGFFEVIFFFVGIDLVLGIDWFVWGMFGALIVVF